MLPRRWFAVGLLLLPLAAWPHTPGVLDHDQVLVIDTPKISKALYGTFEHGDEVFRMTMDLDEDFAMPVELFVPHRSDLAQHRPAWAIVGERLPLPTDEERAALPSPLGAGRGAIVDLNRIEPRPAFYEFVTRRFFWSTGALGVVLPMGHYEIWIWSPAGTRGKFGLGFGVEEGGGYLNALKNWSDYAY